MSSFFIKFSYFFLASFKKIHPFAVIFQGFYIHFKKFFDFQLFLKFLNNLVLEHTSMAAFFSFFSDSIVTYCWNFAQWRHEKGILQSIF